MSNKSNQQKKVLPKKNRLIEQQRQKPIQKSNQAPKIIHKIDAQNQVLGRLATQIANLLRGKNKPSFRPYLVMGDKVIVYNANKIKVTGKKMTDKIYYHHTSYIGHLKSKTMKEIYLNNPGEILKRAVWGMLPKNKLRSHWIKNLIIFNNQILNKNLYSISQGVNNGQKD